MLKFASYVAVSRLQLCRYRGGLQGMRAGEGIKIVTKILLDFYLPSSQGNGREDRARAVWWRLVVRTYSYVDADFLLYYFCM